MDNIENKNDFKGHHLKDKTKTNISPRQQSFNYFTKIIDPPINKGLYHNNNDLYNKGYLKNNNIASNTPPTSTNYTMLLSQTSTTPGANLQYNGSSRLGNNHTAMPGIYWYNPNNNNNNNNHQNMYNILGPL